ncbi:MAG: tetratricopeptide repeat protein [Flavobacteriales bacterium]
MNKINLLILISFLSFNVFAQKSNVQNAYKALKKEKVSEAVEYIELAYNNESTSNDVKMLNYRGQIYFEVHSNSEFKSIDKMAILKCAESWLRLSKHPKAGKWFDKSELNDNITKAGVGLFNKGVELYSMKEYDNSKLLFNKIFDLIPFDEAGNLSRSNVTKESIWLNMFYVSSAQGDNMGSKQYLQNLIDVNYQDPLIYSYMSDVYLNEGNQDKALEVIKEGREYFETDVNLIIAELNYYLANENYIKAEELLKLAVEEDPNNPKLFFALGSSYDELGKFEEAESAYREAVDIDPNFYDAQYNLGIMYYNKAGKMLNEANSIKDFNKYDAAKNKADKLMLKGLPHIEACYEMQPDDKNILIVLKELYYRNGNEAKYKEIVSKLN